MASRLTEAQKTLKTLAAGAKKEGRIFLALIALAVVGRRASSTFRFFVMAGLDPAIHENAESRNQANDNVT
jgi:hypothetical protein